MEASPSSPSRVAELICDRLNPLMVEFGFQEGQGGMHLPTDASAVEILFCAPSEVFQLRLPGLAPGLEWQDGECTDLTIRAVREPEWGMLEPTLEGELMGAVLRTSVPHLAGEVRSALDRQIEAAVDRVEALLRCAFEETRSSRLDWR